MSTSSVAHLWDAGKLMWWADEAAARLVPASMVRVDRRP